MKDTFHIVDVFSSTPFGGNQLAVPPDAVGISTAFRSSNVSMRRRSKIEAEARKSGNVVTSVSVGGPTT